MDNIFAYQHAVDKGLKRPWTFPTYEYGPPKSTAKQFRLNRRDVDSIAAGQSRVLGGQSTLIKKATSVANGIEIESADFTAEDRDTINNARNYLHSLQKNGPLKENVKVASTALAKERELETATKRELETASKVEREIARERILETASLKLNPKTQIFRGDEDRTLGVGNRASRNDVDLKSSSSQYKGSYFDYFKDFDYRKPIQYAKPFFDKAVEFMGYHPEDPDVLMKLAEGGYKKFKEYRLSKDKSESEKFRESQESNLGSEQKVHIKDEAVPNAEGPQQSTHSYTKPQNDFYHANNVNVQNEAKQRTKFILDENKTFYTLHEKPIGNVKAGGLNLPRDERYKQDLANQYMTVNNIVNRYRLLSEEAKKQSGSQGAAVNYRVPFEVAVPNGDLESPHDREFKGQINKNKFKGRKVSRKKIPTPYA